MNIIGAFDRSRVSDLVPRPNSILIMITSPESDFPKVDGKWCKVLSLKFHDVEWREEKITSNDKLYEYFSENQAKQILDFVVENMDKDIFVSCDAGISRSTGVVVALEQIFNSKDVSDDYPHHNRFVKNMIRDTWFKRIWEK